jgi:hypothetical protein
VTEEKFGNVLPLLAALPRRQLLNTEDDCCYDVQLAHSKAAEIEGLLGRLSDANDNMSSALSGASDVRSHTLARHRDILHDFNQVGTASRSSWQQ